MALAQLDLFGAPATRSSSSYPSRARTAPQTQAAAVYAAPVAVYWWLIQGMVLGAVGGSIVSAVVIALVLGLRFLLTGA
jgi:hypothetical protein